jgi:serine protease Do
MKNHKLVCLSFLLAVFLTAPAVAQERVVPEGRGPLMASYAPIVKKTAPAVVNIYTRKIVKQRVLSPFLDDPFFQQFFGGLPQGMTRDRLEKSLGSGVIVRADGLIVTNNHVIADADEITVMLNDKREFEAKLMTADERSDLAVLRINPKGETLPSMELGDSDNAEVGDIVLAVGNPFGVGQTVTSGIISAVARTAVDINDWNYFIQTDAAINPGNSGGALVSMDGKLLGINSAIFTRSGGNMGIGFAIPSNMVRAIVKAVTDGKKSIVRPWTGIEGQEVTSELAASLNLKQPIGMLINDIHPSSPAHKAGLKVGDVIMGVNGKLVEDPEAFRYRIATLSVGAIAHLEVMRHGEKLSDVRMELVAPPEDMPRKETAITGANPLSGATIANLSPALAEELGLRHVEKGVVITKVSGGVSARLGLQPGDFVVAVNRIEVKSVAEVQKLTSQKQRQWSLTIRRGDQVVNLVVGG